MKNKNKIILALGAILIGSMFVFADNTKNITDLTVIGDNELSFNIGDNLDDVDFESADFKVLEKINLSDITLDSEKKGNILIYLEKETLEKGKSYSLFFSKGIDLGLDFVYNPNNENIFEYINPDLESNIEKIKVADGNFLELTLKDTTDFESINLMKEINKVDFKKEDKFVLTFDDTFKKEKEYIFIVVSIKNKDNKDIELGEYIYNFKKDDIVISNESLEENIDENSGNNKTEDSAGNAEENLELNAGTDLETTGKEELKNIEEVAINEIKKTPSTGTSTNILIFLTMILSLGLFIKNRFLK